MSICGRRGRVIIHCRQRNGSTENRGYGAAGDCVIQCRSRTTTAITNTDVTTDSDTYADTYADSCSSTTSDADTNAIADIHTDPIADTDSETAWCRVPLSSRWHTDISGITRDPAAVGFLVLVSAMLVQCECIRSADDATGRYLSRWRGGFTDTAIQDGGM